MQSKQVPSVSPVDALTKGASPSFDVTGDIKFTSYANDANYTNNENQVISPEYQFTPMESDDNQEAVLLSNRQGFRLNDYNFMVKFTDGNQISEIPEIYPLPNSPSWFLGMANVSGQTLPIFDLKGYFGIEDTQQEFILKKEQKVKPMLFVVQHAENATGIIIDGLLERLDISDKQIQQNIDIPKKLGNFIDNVYLLNNEIWYDIDCLAFLDDIEARIIIS